MKSRIVLGYIIRVVIAFLMALAAACACTGCMAVGDRLAHRVESVGITASAGDGKAAAGFGASVTIRLREPKGFAK